jgi:peptidylprolyl isomerase
MPMCNSLRWRSLQGYAACLLVGVSLAALLSACSAKALQKPSSSEATAAAVVQSDAPYRSAAEIIASAPASDWRTLDPNTLMVMRFASGEVVIELAEAFAPKHVANLRVLSEAGYFDGLAIVRSQDNFVVQWGDPNADSAERRSLGQASKRVDPEFERSSEAVAFTALPDPDGYAPEVGFSAGFPAARDPANSRIWLAHCYGMVGAGRDVDSDSGSGAELYAVTGHAPRQLDRNIALIGRVVQGIEVLATQARGPAPMGFYSDAAQRTPILSVRMASALKPEQQPRLEALRTDSASFSALIEARRNRRDSWYKRPAGYIDLCNVPLPVRVQGSQ